MRIKQIWAILYFAILPLYNAHAADDTPDIKTDITSSDLTIFDFTDIRARLEPIKLYIMTQDPEFAESLYNMSDVAQVAAVRSWLAEQSLEYYFEYYMQMLRDESEKTGRRIKKEDFKYVDVDQVYYWLDRGELDNEEKCYNFEKRLACDYPDGFTNFSITYDKTKEKTLRVDFDRPEQNKTYSIKISLTNDGITYDENASNTSSYYLYIITEETDYDEYYKWQNQQRADIRAGMMIPIKYEGDENSPFAYTGTGWTMDTSKQWASQKLPATKVRSETMDWSFKD